MYVVLFVVVNDIVPSILLVMPGVLINWEIVVSLWWLVHACTYRDEIIKVKSYNCC